MEELQGLALHLLFYFMLFFISSSSYDDKPQVPLCLQNQDSLCADAVFRHAQDLADLGPRVTGSVANEDEAVGVILSAVKTLAGRESVHKIEWDVQKADGRFFLDAGDGQTMSYAGLQNVVVRLRSGYVGQESVLLNCHFDTVPLSPGASDDAVACGILLETLRVLANETRLAR